MNYQNYQVLCKLYHYFFSTIHPDFRHPQNTIYVFLPHLPITHILVIMNLWHRKRSRPLTFYLQYFQTKYLHTITSFNLLIVFGFSMYSSFNHVKSLAFTSIQRTLQTNICFFKYLSCFWYTCIYICIYIVSGLFLIQYSFFLTCLFTKGYLFHFHSSVVIFSKSTF